MKPVRALLVFSFCLPVVSHALSPEPSAIEKDGLRVTPTLNVGLVSDDNFYSASSGLEENAMLYTVAPAVVVHRGTDEDYGKIEASAKAGTVDVDSSDDFLEMSLMFAGRNRVAPKSSVEGFFGYLHGYDARGTGNTRGCFPACDAEPDIYNQLYLRIASQYGSTDSRGRLSGMLQATKQDYTNNTARTDAYDYRRYSGAFKFAWGIGGSTNAIFEINPEVYDYAASSAADSFGMTYLAGVEWAITGKTTGYAKGGMQSKDFESSTRGDLDEGTWGVGINWMPTEHSALNLSYSQSFQESDVTGADAIQLDSYSVRYSVRPLDRVEPWLSYAHGTSEYQGITREDETSTMSAGVDYKFRRWVVFGLSWKSTEATSDAPGLDYDRGIIALNANMTL